MVQDDGSGLGFRIIFQDYISGLCFRIMVQDYVTGIMFQGLCFLNYVLGIMGTVFWSSVRTFPAT